jgi:hypothetical protein
MLLARQAFRHCGHDKEDPCGGQDNADPLPPIESLHE